MGALEILFIIIIIIIIMPAYLVAALDASRFGLGQVDVVDEHFQLLVLLGSVHKACKSRNMRLYLFFLLLWTYDRVLKTHLEVTYQVLVPSFFSVVDFS